MKLLAACLAFVLFGIPLLHAQTQTTGLISGSIFDASGALVAKATVTVLNSDKGLRRYTLSSLQGIYTVPLLDPGRYSVTVAAPGFETVSRQGITVGVDHAVSVNFRLKVGHSQEQVVVSGQPPLIETDNPNTTTTLNAQQIEDMPNPGNDLTYLATVAPGAIMNTVNSGGYNGGNLEFNGLPTTANDYTIDGLSGNDSWENSNSSGATGLMLGANAIQEVSINTQSYSVEQGRLGAAQLNYTTKSGSNSFHGNAYEIWNGSALNTTNYFIKANPNPPKKPRSNVNEFGASVGGPILKNRLFFFTDFEGLRIVLPSVQNATIPTQYYESYVLQQLPLGGYDTVYGQALPAQPAEVPYYQKLFSLYPNSSGGAPLRATGCPFDTGGATPSAANTNDGNGCALSQLRSFSNPLAETLWTLRLDYTIGNSDSAWIRTQIDNGSNTTPNVVNSLYDVHDNQPLKGGSAGWTHTFRTSLVNQFNPGVSYVNRVHDVANYAAAYAAAPVMVVATPFSDFGLLNIPYGDSNVVYQVADNVIWSVRNHQLKFGINFLRNRFNSAETAGYKTPEAEALSLPEFTYGASAVTESYFPTYDHDHLAAINLDFYASDLYKVTPNLTISYGLRVAFNSNPKSYDKVLARLVEPFEQLSHDVTTPLNQSILGNQAHLFASTPLFIYQPRAAIAYKMHPHTVWRIGGGLFTAPTQGFLPTYADENPPSFASFTTGLFYGQGIAIFPGVPGSSVDAGVALNQAFQKGYSEGALPCAAPGATSDCTPAVSFTDLEGAHRHFKYPVYYQWNAGVEQQLGSSRVFSVKYVGTRSIQGFYSASPNAYQSSCQGCWGSYAYQTAPDPRFGGVFSFRTGANSAYHALQASFDQNLSHGLFLRVNYTWSHCLDDGSNGGVTIFQDNTDFYAFDGQLKHYHGSCDYDVTNSLNATYSYALPTLGNNRMVKSVAGGWKVAGNVYVRGGFPFTVYSAYPSQINNSSVVYNLLANVVPGVHPYAKSTISDVTTLGTIQWLNPQAFQSVVDPNTGSCYPMNSPQYCQNGDMGRNSVRLPGFNWTDMTITKSIPLPRELSFRFDAEFFNLFNHPNFGLPTSANGYAGSPIAGIPSEPGTVSGFGVINTTVGPSTGLLGSPSIGGDSSVRMIAFRGTINF